MSARPFLLALLAAALFGAATPLSKSLLAELGPFQLSGLLYLGAAMGVAPLLLRDGGVRPPWRMEPRTRRLLAGAILFGGILGPVLLLFGLRLAAATSVSLWLNLEAVMTALLGFFVFHDRLGRNGWLGAVGIVVAAVMLTWGQGAAGWTAGLLVAAATFCWALDNHFTALIDGITPAQSTFWKGLVAGLANVAIGLLVEPRLAPPAEVLLALGVGVFAYGMSITLYIGAAHQLGATRSQLVFSTAPYFGIALAVAWLGETIGLVEIAAALLTGISVVLLTVDWHAHPHTHVPLEHEHWHRHDEHHAHAHDGTPGSGHNHRHAHVPLAHQHRHLPDLHHRHEH